MKCFDLFNSTKRSAYFLVPSYHSTSLCNDDLIDIAFLHPHLSHMLQNKLCSILVCPFSLSYCGNALCFVEVINITQALHKSAVMLAPLLFSNHTLSTMHDICSVTSCKSKQSAYQAESTSLFIFGQVLLHFASAFPLSLWKPTLPFQISHPSRPCVVQV